MNIKNWHPVAKLAIVCVGCLTIAVLIGFIAYLLQG